MVSNDDWRLQGQEDYLLGETLYWRKYTAYSETWEHDHCSFCFHEFAESDSNEVLHEGYATEDRYHWICQGCFEDFKDMFQWVIGQ